MLRSPPDIMRRVGRDGIGHAPTVTFGPPSGSWTPSTPSGGGPRRHISGGGWPWPWPHWWGRRAYCCYEVEAMVPGGWVPIAFGLSYEEARGIAAYHVLVDGGLGARVISDFDGRVLEQF